MISAGGTQEKSNPLRTLVIQRHKIPSILVKFACFASTSTCLFATNGKPSVADLKLIMTTRFSSYSLYLLYRIIFCCNELCNRTQISKSVGVVLAGVFSLKENQKHWQK